MSAIEFTEDDIVQAARALDLAALSDDAVVAHVAARWGLSAERLVQKDRQRGRLQAARRELYATLHALGRSWPQIARLVGRHHASCHQAVAGKRRRRPRLLGLCLGNGTPNGVDSLNGGR